MTDEASAVRILCLYLIRIDLSTTVLVVNTKLRTQYTVLEGKREVNLEKLFCSFPNAYCLLVIISLFVNNERINTIPDIIYSGIVQITWYYTQCNASGVVACRLPGTIRCLGQTLYQSNI